MSIYADSGRKVRNKKLRIKIKGLVEHICREWGGKVRDKKVEDKNKRGS